MIVARHRRRRPCHTSQAYSPIEMSSVSAAELIAAAKSREQEALDDACAICLCTIDSRDRDILACGHEFCSGCITCWLDANTKCPLCRADPVLTRLGQSDISNVRINMTGFDHYIPRQLELLRLGVRLLKGKDTTQNVPITREQLDGGKRYFIVHPEFDVPECEGGDPRTRGMRRATCTRLQCPCKSFVAKILIFQGKFIIYKPEYQPCRRLFKSQHCIINEGQRDEHMVYAQGAIFRSQIVEWSHATIPVKRRFDFSDIIVPPPPVVSELRARHWGSANPRHPNCPFVIGQRVMKLRGVGAYEEGIVIYINREGTKINVEKASGDGTWHLQRFSNYCASGFT